MGPSSGCGYATRGGMEQKATDGVGSRFAQDHPRGLERVHGEVAEIFLGTGRQAAPTYRSGTAQFGAHGCVFFSQEQEDRIAAAIGIEFAGFDEAIHHRRGEGTVMDEVMLDEGKLAA